MSTLFMALLDLHWSWQMKAYTIIKVYDFEFGDLAPATTAEIPHVILCILDTDTGGMVTRHSFDFDQAGDRTLTIHRRGDHCNGILTLDSTPNE